jgi:hypothetical protein
MRYGKGFATATLAMLTVGCAYTSPEPDFIIRKAEYDGRQQAVQDNRAIQQSNPHSGISWTDAFRPSVCMGCHWGGGPNSPDGFESNGRGSVNPSRSSAENPYNSL